MFHTNLVEKIQTHMSCSIIFCEYRAVYGIMWKNVVELGRPHMTIWRLHTACRITESTKTRAQNMKHLLHLHWDNGCISASQCYVYSYIACLVLLSRRWFVCM